MKKEYFWADETLQKKLRTIPQGERSVVIRIILRDWFGLTNFKEGVVGYKETIDDIETAIERSSHE